MHYMRSFFILIALVGTTAAVAAPEVILTKRSLYRNITVTDNGDMTCMQFTNRNRYYSQQSCQYHDKPDELVFDYARLSFVGLLINPQPKRILVVGMGGGSIPRTFAKLFPDAKVDSIEIDPAVIDVAERYFDFETTDNMEVIARDARVFVKQAGIFGRKYDYIMLDAFNGDYIPEHLMTKEWLEEVKAILTDGGVVVANTFSISDLYHNESATYEAAFGWIRNVKMDSGNRLILTGKFDEVSQGELMKRARMLDSEKYQQFGFSLGWIASNVHDEADWDRDARVLTDQYSPVNLLQGTRNRD